MLCYVVRGGKFLVGDKDCFGGLQDWCIVLTSLRGGPYLTQSIDYKGVCRTAPATPGLLKKAA